MTAKVKENTTVSVSEFMGKMQNSPSDEKHNNNDLVRVPSTIPQPQQQVLHNGDAIAGAALQHFEHAQKQLIRSASASQENRAEAEQAAAAAVMNKQQILEAIQQQQSQAAQLLLQQQQYVNQMQSQSHANPTTRHVRDSTDTHHYNVPHPATNKSKAHHHQQHTGNENHQKNSSYADEREGVVKGNLKVVYEQVGELFKENKTLREEVELSKLQIQNLKAMLEEKSMSYDLLLEKLQNRATCSNEDFDEKLKMLGLESQEPASIDRERDAHAHGERKLNDNGDFMTAVKESNSLTASTMTSAVGTSSNLSGSLPATSSNGGSTPHGTESTASSSVKNGTGSSTRDSTLTPRVVHSDASMPKSHSDASSNGSEGSGKPTAAGFTSGSSTVTRDHMIFSPRAEALRSHDVVGSSFSRGVESDSERSSAFKPLKMMNDSAIFSKLNSSGNSAGSGLNHLGHAKSFAVNVGRDLDEYYNIRNASATGASLTTGGAAPAPAHALPPGLGLEMGASQQVSATSSASSAVHNAQQKIAQARNQLIYLCDKHGVDVRTVEWFLLPENCIYWETLAMKLEEIDRRATMQDGHFKVKNPSAWLTKFFNTIRKQGNNGEPGSGGGSVSGITKPLSSPMREPLQHHASAVSASSRVTSFFPSGHESN